MEAVEAGTAEKWVGHGEIFLTEPLFQLEGVDYTPRPPYSLVSTNFWDVPLGPGK